uniref:Spindle pole body component 110-like n=1 Tax=Strongyloides papillosus TaxID=174720 RepID=A0A0N5CGR8_STREA
MSNQIALVNSYISHFNAKNPSLNLTTDELKSQGGRVNFMDKLYNIYETVVYGLSKKDYFDKVAEGYSEETTNAAIKLHRLNTLCTLLNRYSNNSNKVKLHKFFTPDIQLIASIFKMLETFECVSDAIYDEHLKMSKEYTDKANEINQLNAELAVLEEDLTDDPTTAIMTATHELTQLKDTRRELHDLCVALNSKTSSKREVLHGEKQKIASLRERCEKLEESRKGYEHRYRCEIAKLVTDADDLINERQRLTDAEKAVKNDMRILQSKIEQDKEKKDDILKLSEKINYLDKEIALAEVKTEEISKTSASILGIQQKIESTQKDIVVLKKKIPVFSSKYEELKETSRKNKKEFNDEMRKLKAEVADLYEKFNKAVDVKLEKCQELTKIQEEKAALKSELESLKENVKSEIAKIDEDYNKHKEERREFINDVVEFRKETKLAIHAPEISQLETEVKILETMDKEAIFHKRYLQERGARRQNHSFGQQ